MELEERFKNSLMIFLDGDKDERAEDFANILFSLHKSYYVVGCFVPIDATRPCESTYQNHETEQELADIVHIYSKDHHIAYIVFQKRKVVECPKIGLIIPTGTGMSRQIMPFNKQVSYIYNILIYFKKIFKLFP